MKFLQNERGTVTVLIAFSMVVLLGFTGLLVDVGNCYLQKVKVQNAIDAACLAGAQELPDTAQAYNIALQYAGLNGLDSSEIVVQVSETTVSITANRIIKPFFMSVFGYDSTTVYANAAASRGTAPAFNYTLFSGSSDDTLLLNGNDLYVNGSAHTNENFRANGSSISITGACEAVGTVQSNGNNLNISYPCPYSSYVDMPDYQSEIIEQAQNAGTVYSSSQQFNGNNIYVEDSIYICGNATLNGNRIYGAGAILTTGNITINGNCISATTDDQICLYSNQDITINGNSIEIHGILYAPNGKITFNGNNITVYGKVIGYRTTFNGNDITINGDDCEVISLPSKGSRLVL